MKWPKSWLKPFFKSILIGGIIGSCQSRIHTEDREEVSHSFSYPLVEPVERIEEWRQSQIKELSRRVYRVEVRIKYPYGQDSYRGTAWLWKREGVLVTCRHLLPSGSSRLEIEIWDYSGACYPAALVWKDTIADVAFLWARGLEGVPFQRAENSELAVPGSTVLSVGAPWGLLGTFQEGFISGEKRYILTPIAKEALPFLQLSLPAQPGSSGSPVFNRRGEVIGMLSDIATTSGLYEGLAFAIPVEILENVWREYCSFAGKYDTAGTCTSY
ncbi:MAG: S1C family serine protease [Bacteroidia bacterium]|nr:S1C family serine protease [Bacteroidia bacterium]MDW8134286.1 S1C family serine protease [Bacteroidia bacterium]